MNPVARNPHAACAIALVTPLAILAALRFLADTGPSSAPAASPIVAALPSLPAPTMTATPQLKRATEWLAAWKPAEQIPSPMLYPKHEEEAPEPATAAPATAPEGVVPAFAVKTVMGSGERVMASINGKVYRVGDEPAPGWKITSMDAKSKRVEITGPDGQVVSITPQAKPR